MIPHPAHVLGDVRRVLHPSVAGVLIAFLALFLVDLKNSFNYASLQSTVGIQSLDAAVRSRAVPCFSPDAIDTSRCRDPRDRLAAESNMNMAANSARLGVVAERLDTAPGMIEFLLHEMSSGWGLSLVAVLVAVTSGLQSQTGEQNRALISLGSRRTLLRTRVLSVTLMTMTVSLTTAAVGLVWVNSRHDVTVHQMTAAATTPAVREIVRQIFSTATWGEWTHLLYRVPFAVLVVCSFVCLVSITPRATVSVGRSLLSGFSLVALSNVMAKVASPFSVNSAASAVMRLGDYVGLHDVRSSVVPGRPTGMNALGGIDSTVASLSVLAVAAQILLVLVLVLRYCEHP